MAWREDPTSLWHQNLNNLQVMARSQAGARMGPFKEGLGREGRSARGCPGGTSSALGTGSESDAFRAEASFLLGPEVGAVRGSLGQIPQPGEAAEDIRRKSKGREAKK